MKKKEKREGKKVEVEPSQIAELVEDNERYIGLSEEEIEAMHVGTSVPLSLRISEVRSAILLHMAELMNQKKGGLAADLLNAAIYDAFKYLHRDKTPEEFAKVWSQVTDKYFNCLLYTSRCV